MKTLKEQFEELNSVDQDSFRSMVLGKLCPEALDAAERVEERLQRHYEARFEKKGF